MRLATASLTDQGGRRRNEDSLGTWSTDRLYYCVVADGAGGHGGGDAASRIVVDTTLANLRFLTVAERPPTGQRLAAALHHANDSVVEEQSCGSAELQDMRSTAVVLAIDLEHGTASWAHCGDTRLYHVRDGQILAQTLDHSMVQQMVAARLLSPDDARHHPRRNVLLSALGSREGLEIASLAGTVALHERDAFLICTDGLWEYVNEAFMLDALARSATPEEWLAELAVQVRATARANHDNFSACAIWVGEVSDVTVLLPTAPSPSDAPVDH